jgi:prepilin-type N-terminal cleavage/methylation domain-containing protein
MQTRVHRMQRTISTGRHGFTRVELIVVMAVLVILALLALMLLPTKGGSKHRAQRIACISNLKHIGLAFRIYVNDNEDLFPTLGWREQAALIGRDPHPRQIFAVLSTNMVTPQVLRCPADRRKWFVSRAWQPTGCQFPEQLTPRRECAIRCISGGCETSSAHWLGEIRSAAKPTWKKSGSLSPAIGRRARGAASSLRYCRSG